MSLATQHEWVNWSMNIVLRWEFGPEVGQTRCHEPARRQPRGALGLGARRCVSRRQHSRAGETSREPRNRRDRAASNGAERGDDCRGVHRNRLGADQPGGLREPRHATRRVDTNPCRLWCDRYPAPRAMFANRVKCGKNATRTIPVGPERCLATRISAVPMSGESAS